MKKLQAIFFAFFAWTLGFLYAKPLISVSIPPQAYFLKQIAGDTVEIHTLIPQGADPHTFEFKPQMILDLQKSDLYLTMGLEFEHIWIPKLKNNLAHTQILSIAPITKDPHTHKHSHHLHHHNPHTWLSPMLVKDIAHKITQILISHYPQHKALYEHNLNAFLEQINALHQNITNQLKSLKNRTFITYHPAWGHFAKEFQLKEISIEFEGKEPTPQILAQTLKAIKTHHIKVIFVQNGFSTQAASTLAKQTGASIWITNPLAYDWEQEMLHFAQGLIQ
ncbi:metal ABC transporter solute-binding protein, Zn/Mn family [Helicobacter pametensis]|uniref:metal ABC transporter solute-binding protein, Zn/Mn family n=1 Tax=Helicobacter pametensis TaxID=95149 RepID=UPI0004B738E2|nr:zinc ABC transporter substrate-binding protein [Helicobacter pametensis]